MRGTGREVLKAIQPGERFVSLSNAPRGIFEDRALSSTRDDLPGLLALLAAAKQEPAPFRKVYVLDTSRIARDTLQAQSLKYYLRKKRGIELTFLHLPQTGSYMDEAIEKMMEVWDELHSRMSKASGVEGQRQNVRRGYRGGGEAPYGYRRRVVVTSQHRNGQPITKSTNEPDPETAPVVQEYFRRRASGENRSVILRDFERRGIPSPRGRAQWTATTARGFEENLLAYLGHLVYGRMNERLRDHGMVGGKKRGFVGGQRLRPQDDWVIHENAHTPLITPEIASRVQVRLRTLGVSDRRGTAYLLSGLLRCGVCGEHYIGSVGDGQYLYRCLTRSKRGRAACANSDIARDTIEGFAVRILKEELLREERITDLVRRFQRRPLTQRRRVAINEPRQVGRDDARGTEPAAAPAPGGPQRTVGHAGRSARGRLPRQPGAAPGLSRRHGAVDARRRRRQAKDAAPRGLPRDKAVAEDGPQALDTQGACRRQRGGTYSPFCGVPDGTRPRRTSRTCVPAETCVRGTEVPGAG